MKKTHVKGRRLLVASNRLPFTLSEEGAEIRFVPSAGGLVTGLHAYVRQLDNRQTSSLTHIWFGWPGRTVDDADQALVRSRALEEAQAVPLFLSQRMMEDFYNGFCNKTLWPLFHSFPGLVVYQQDFWDQYVEVNRAFARMIVEAYHPGDTIWIHDYHLMLLPRMLREALPDASIGFFLHIPFPPYELFRLLPGVWRREILEGLLGADLAGFHTYEYAQYFLQSVLRIQGLEHQLGQITLPDHIFRAGSYPMGIDAALFAATTSDPVVVEERRALRATVGERKMILSVDRLDYTKGILNRLLAYEQLCERYPAWKEKMVMLMVVVPSRIGVDHYEQMKKQIEETVGRVNGRHGSLQWTPVVYQYRHVPFAPLVGLYAESDVALVTPLRDGMNLVAKEYVACRDTGMGVLVLSEMAGAAKELGESILVNPNDVTGITDALHEALEMPVDEQKRRNAIMRGRISRYDVHRWANDFLADLDAMKAVRERMFARLMTAHTRQEIRKQFLVSSRRLFLLDYDGTLVPLARRPADARPSPQVLQLLQGLAADQRNTVVLVSGRDRATLTHWFGHLPVGLVAEHGVWIRVAGGAWTSIKDLKSEWKAQILPILLSYADRLPGASLEEKEHSIAWHYRTADPEQARPLEAELADHLLQLTSSVEVQVLRGSKVIEVRNSGVNKGTASGFWTADGSFDFICAIGDDTTDEDTFAALPESAITIRVGLTSTKARFSLRDPRDVLQLLELLLPASS
jgi:trehalose 6-phosphate synthase/phosphatase